MNTISFQPQVMEFVVKATVLLAFAWAIHGLLRPWHPRWRVLLWRAIFCGLILLPLLIKGLPPVRVSAPLWLVAARSEKKPTGQGDDPKLSEGAAAASGVPLPREETNQKEDSGVLPAPGSPEVRQAMSRSGILFVVWLLGWGVLMIRFAIVSWFSRRGLRRLSPAPEALKSRSDRICAELGVKRRVAVKLSDDVSSPMLMGIINPVIVLPASRLETLDESDLTAMLAHEIAHVIGADLAWNCVLRWMEMALWFHPLLWPARRAHGAACEEVCDALAAAYLGNATRYGQTLARVALTAHARRLALNGLPMARAHSVVSRLNRLQMNVGRRRIRRSLLIAAGIAALLLIGATATIHFRAIADEAAPVQHASKPFVVRCVDEMGQPVPDAEVYLEEWNAIPQMYHADNKDTVFYSRPLRTNASGLVEFQNPIVFNGRNYMRRIFARVHGKLVGGQRINYSASEGSPEEPPQPAVVTMAPSGPLRGTVKLPAGGDPRKIVVTWLSFHAGATPGAGGMDFFGAQRTFGKPEPWPELVERTPDKDGRFQFDDMPLQGLVFLAANGPGLGEAQYRTAETERDGFTLEMEPECVIEGQITYASTGQPAAGARVYARSRGSRMMVTHHYEAQADADGHYRIGHLFEGSFVVNTGPNGPWRVMPPNILIHPDKPGVVDFALEPGAIVAGHVTDEATHAPVPDILISAVVGRSGGEGLDSARTDADGRYQLRLPTGDSLIYVASAGGAFEYPKDQARRIVTIAGERVVEGNVDFALARRKKELLKGLPCVARGRVLDQDGKGIPNVLLTYHVQPLPKREDGIGNFGGPLGVTNADGSYEVKLQPYSDYEIAAGGVLHSSVMSKHFETGSGTVHTIEDLVVRPALGSAAGVVVDENGQPIKNVTIEPSSKHKYASGANDVRSDAEGGFQIQHLLTDEPFTLHAFRDGYAARQFYALAPGINDYRIILPHEASPPPAIDYNKRLDDGKRLIGGAAPAWEVTEWIQKLDRMPNPKRDDGRWTVLFFVRSSDDAGAALAKLVSATRASNAAPVAIFHSFFDAHLPMTILKETPLQITVGMDRFSADTGMTENSVTRMAYGRQSIYVLDEAGVVRGATSKMEDVEQLIGKK